jgi:hypothetical protein
MTGTTKAVAIGVLVTVLSMVIYHKLVAPALNGGSQ